MNKLAINSFIAITAMAWGAADLRTPAAGIQAPATISTLHYIDKSARRGYDRRARDLLSSWRAGQQCQALAAGLPTPVIGACLDADLLAVARRVPEHVTGEPDTGQSGLEDWLVGALLVRVEQGSLRIVDVMA